MFTTLMLDDIHFTTLMFDGIGFYDLDVNNSDVDGIAVRRWMVMTFMLGGADAYGTDVDGIYVYDTDIDSLVLYGVDVLNTHVTT